MKNEFLKNICLKICLVLTILLTLVMPKNFAMISESPREFVALELMPEKKFQQLFFLNIEQQLQKSIFRVFLEVETLTKAKEALYFLDGNKENIQCIKNGISTLLDVQLLFLYNMPCVQDERRAFIQGVLFNLEWITIKLFKRLVKTLAKPESQFQDCIINWEDIYDNVIGEKFSTCIKVINQFMHKCTADPSRCVQLLNQVYEISDAMKLEIDKEVDTYLQADHIQVLSAINSKIANFAAIK